MTRTINIEKDIADWKANNPRTPHQIAQNQKAYIALRQAPYWYDRTYGTNHFGLNGRIPSIIEIENVIDKPKATLFDFAKALLQAEYNAGKEANDD